ncbi:extracellular calcium-sensing receptor-like [Hyperolius riggenbachi]|uniref:extracellular calcium-sensing receptor-like n=1 Tax=Hyperolius riggenbachi TaxID=752182 RepID=UPI0035A366E7
MTSDEQKLRPIVITRCQLPVMLDLDGVTQSGDVMIGVLLPIHSDKVYQKMTFQESPPRTACTIFDLEAYQMLQTLFFAVEEINMNWEILPNLTLGFQMFDTCNIPHYELQGALEYLTESSPLIPNYRGPSKSPFTAVIGSVVSSNSITLANILGILRYPQISPLSGVPLLSNRQMFPSFFRTIAGDTFQTKGLAKLVLYFGWTWVGLLAADNDYGQSGIQPIKKEILKAGGCVAFTETILQRQPDRNAPHIVKVIKESTVTVIIAFAVNVDVVPIMNEMITQNVSGKIFVANAGWSKSNMFLPEKYFEVLSGTIGLGNKSPVIPGLSDYLLRIEHASNLRQNWMKSFWERIFNCKFLGDVSNSSESQICTGNESVSSVRKSSIYSTSLKYTHNIYAAVQVLARSLDNMGNCKEKGGYNYPWTYTSLQNFKPWQLLPYIQNIRITLSSGREIYFNKNGEVSASYDIVNWQKRSDGSFCYAEVGSYEGSTLNGSEFSIDFGLLQWIMGDSKVPRSVCSESCPPGFRKAALQGQPVCCYECLPCLQGEVSNQTDSVVCIKCSWDQWPNSLKTICVPKKDEFLSFKDPLGAILAAVSISSSLVPFSVLKIFIQHKHTAIIKASNYKLSCLLLTLLTLCFLSALVFIGYPHPEKCLLRQPSFGLIFALCVSCILAKTIMVVLAFMATRPGSSLLKWSSPQVSYAIISTCFLVQFVLCIIWLSITPPFPQNNIETKPGFIIVECNEGSLIAFWTMLGYLFLLSTISFIFAFLARRLPDSFNEAQFITFSMLAFLSVWISFIPAYLSAQGKYTVAMEIFAILASSWALVICMFIPKCFVIIFRPDLNSREHLMGRSKTMT